MKSFGLWLARVVIDLGLLINSWGPKDPEDRENDRRLINLWRKTHGKPPL